MIAWWITPAIVTLLFVLALWLIVMDQDRLFAALAIWPLLRVALVTCALVWGVFYLIALTTSDLAPSAKPSLSSTVATTILRSSRGS